MPTAPKHPPKPRFALSVGVTGHRPNKLSGDAAVRVQHAIGDVLAVVKQGAATAQADYAACFTPDEPILVVTTALAEGADSMAADTATALGYELDVVLPFAAAEYRNDFSPSGLEEFTRLCGRARAILEIDGDRAAAAKAYEDANLVVLDMSDILIAVWDGKPAAGRGGTAELVHEAARRGMPIIRIDAEGRIPTKVYWRGLSDRHTAPVHIDGHPFAELERSLPEILSALVRPPRADGEKKLLQRYFGETVKTTSLRVEFPLLMALMGVRWLRWSDMRLPQPDALSRQIFDNEDAPVSLAVAYSWADAIAIRFAQVFRSAFVVNFLISALAVIAAVINLDPPWSLVGIALVFVLVLNTIIGQKSHWHRRWIEAREVAERLRIAMPMRAIGTRAFGPFGDAPTWTTWYVRAKLREPGLCSGALNAAGLTRARDTLFMLLGGQRNYHAATAHRFHLLHNRLAAFSTGLFLTALLMSSAQFVVEYFHLYPITAETNRWIVIISAGLPALGGASYGIRVIGEFDAASRRSRRMTEQLEALLVASENASDSFDRLRDIAHHAADVITGDVASWRLVVENRELEMPG